MVMAALAMTALLLFGALALDVGAIWSSRTQSQNADDSAALAAAQKMIKQVGTGVPTVELDDARAEGITYAAANATVSNPSVTLQNSDFEFGFWDLATRTLDTSVDKTDPDLVTGVRVNVRMDGTDNQRSPSFLSQLLGRNGFDVNNTAVAYLGFEGEFDPGEFDLPVAIDSCDIVSDNGCGSDYCDTIANPPNPCLLDDPQAGEATTNFTCLEFSSTGEQNACWTAFDGDSPSINPPKLNDIVDAGNAGDVQSGDEVYLDNGDKAATQAYISDKMYGNDAYAGNPAGVDRYPPFDGNEDSWVVKLPVVECQDVAHCAGPSTYAITGGVCFEVREIAAPPTTSAKEIRGRFLCSKGTQEERDLIDEFCRDDDDEPNGPGGCNFGFRANKVVLVE
jgi:hypothetical protein